MSEKVESKSAKEKFYAKELDKQKVRIVNLQCQLVESTSTVVRLQCRLKKLKQTEEQLKKTTRLVEKLKVIFQNYFPVCTLSSKVQHMWYLF